MLAEPDPPGSELATTELVGAVLLVVAGVGRVVMVELTSDRLALVEVAALEVAELDTAEAELSVDDLSAEESASLLVTVGSGGGCDAWGGSLHALATRAIATMPQINGRWEVVMVEEFAGSRSRLPKLSTVGTVGPWIWCGGWYAPGHRAGYRWRGVGESRCAAGVLLAGVVKSGLPTGVWTRRAAWAQMVSATFL